MGNIIPNSEDKMKIDTSSFLVAMQKFHLPTLEPKGFFVGIGILTGVFLACKVLGNENMEKEEDKNVDDSNKFDDRRKDQKEEEDKNVNDSNEFDDIKQENLKEEEDKKVDVSNEFDDIKQEDQKKEEEKIVDDSKQFADIKQEHQKE